TILRHAVPTWHDPLVHATETEWRAALERTEVRYQWDPDRDWRLRKLPRRAIQLGLQGGIVRQCVGWIVGLGDASAMAHSCKRADAEGGEAPVAYPAERVYAVPDDVRRVLGLGA